MPARIVALPTADDSTTNPSTTQTSTPQIPTTLPEALAALRARLEIPADLPPAVTAAAERAVANVRRPDLDRTDLEFVTIDPPGSRDLDQALHIARTNQGYEVSYAIAAVASFVAAGDPVDVEARHRGLTFYAPDLRTPLHPLVLSEGAASLLPGQDRPALLWTLQLDQHGELTAATVVQALVRSREQLTYDQAQQEIDGGAARSTLALLVEVGLLREERERDRGGVSLQIPTQEIGIDDRGQYTLSYRATLPIERFNAQISLLTGIAAARLMLAGRIGIVRTLPPAEPGALQRLRRTAEALRISWPDAQPYADFVRGLEPTVAPEAAMLNACTELFRGAGYAAFDGFLPEQTQHAALATDYAHATAPLRRLIDRFVGEICLALAAGRPVPDWARAALPELPALMTAAEARAKKYERSVIDLVEVSLLRDRVGDEFTGTVVEVESGGKRGTVMLADPAVQARVKGPGLPFGAQVNLRLTAADWATGRAEFART